MRATLVRPGKLISLREAALRLAPALVGKTAPPVLIAMPLGSDCELSSDPRDWISDGVRYLDPTWWALINLAVTHAILEDGLALWCRPAEGEPSVEPLFVPLAVAARLPRPFGYLNDHAPGVDHIRKWYPDPSGRLKPVYIGPLPLLRAISTGTLCVSVADVDRWKCRIAAAARLRGGAGPAVIEPKRNQRPRGRPKKARTLAGAGKRDALVRQSKTGRPRKVSPRFRYFTVAALRTLLSTGRKVSAKELLELVATVAEKQGRGFSDIDRRVFKISVGTLRSAVDEIGRAARSPRMRSVVKKERIIP